MKEKINRVIEELKIKPVLLNIYGSEGEMYTSLLNSVLISDDSMIVKRKIYANIDQFIKLNINNYNSFKFFVAYVTIYGAEKAFDFFNRLDYTMTPVVCEKISTLSSCAPFIRSILKKTKGNDTPLENGFLDEIIEIYIVNNDLLDTYEEYDYNSKVLGSVRDEYCKSLRFYGPLMTLEEQMEKFKMLEEATDPDIKSDIKEEIIMRNSRLVMRMASRYLGRARNLSFMDLVQEGNIGLIKAVDRFDYKLGFRFSTYATWWINQCIQRSIVDRDKSIRIPSHMHEMNYKIIKFSRTYYAEHGEEPDYQTIANNIGETAERVKDTIDTFEKFNEIDSIDRSIGDDGDTSLGEMLSNDDDSIISYSDSNSLREYYDKLFDAIEDSLTKKNKKDVKRLKEIIELRFALNPEGKNYTLNEAGRKLGITRERVRQLESEAIRLLGEQGLKIERECERNNELRTSELENKRASSSNVETPYKSFLRRVNNPSLHITGYSGDDNKVNAKCNDCGYSWKPIGVDLINHNVCPECLRVKTQENNNKLRNKGEVISYLKLINKNPRVANSLTIPQMPNDIFQKVAIHCNNCDEDFYTSLVFLRKSPKCPICTKRKEKATLQKRIDDFIDDLNTRTEGRISYVSSTTQFAMVKLHCNLCNHIWDMPIFEARKNDACPVCNPERFISHVDVIKEKIGNRSKGLIECLEFTEKQTPVKLRCTCCGKEWETTYKEAHEIPICPFCVKEKDKNSITVMDINPLNNDALCDLKVQLLGTHLYHELRDKTQYKRPELVIELLMHIGYLSAPIEIKDIARFDRRPFKDIETFLRNFENTYYNFIHNVTVNGYVSKAYEEATKANKIRIREKRD